MPSRSTWGDKEKKVLHTHQLVVVNHHQLDVLGLGLNGALTSPHLEGAEGDAHGQTSECAVVTRPSHRTNGRTFAQRAHASPVGGKQLLTQDTRALVKVFVLGIFSLSRIFICVGRHHLQLLYHFSSLPRVVLIARSMCVVSRCYFVRFQHCFVGTVKRRSRRIQ